MVKMLENYSEGRIDSFDTEMNEMCVELANNAMGKLMIGVISYIYIEQATQQLGGIGGVASNFKEMGHNVNTKYKIVKSAYNTYKTAK